MKKCQDCKKNMWFSSEVYCADCRKKLISNDAKFNRNDELSPNNCVNIPDKMSDYSRYDSCGSSSSSYCDSSSSSCCDSSGGGD